MAVPGQVRMPLAEMAGPACRRYTSCSSIDSNTGRRKSQQITADHEQNQAGPVWQCNSAQGTHGEARHWGGCAWPGALATG
jgi:hypothetical protein